MTVKFTTVPSKRLAETINASAYSFSLQDIKGWNGSNLAASDFGTDLYASFRNSLGTKLELMKIDPSTIASASITILKRGLGFDGDQSTEVSANIQDVWVKGDTIVELGSDVSQLLEETVRKSGDQTIGGVKTFTEIPKNSGTATDPDHLVNYAKALSMLTGTTSINRIQVAGTAGENLTAGNLVYLKLSDGLWWKCDADTAATVENIILGIAQATTTSGNSISGGVLLNGLDTNQTGLTDKTTYYASNTAGAISSTPGTNEVTLGVSRSTTSLLFIPRYNQQLTEDQQDALAGSSGTPKSSNPFITENDTTAYKTMSATTISFTASTNTIADSANGFVTAGFRAGSSITITGSASNNSTFTIISVAVGAIVVAESLVNESAGATVVITTVNTSKLARRKTDGNLSVPTTPTATTDAASKAYVDAQLPPMVNQMIQYYGTGNTVVNSTRVTAETDGSVIYMTGIATNVSTSIFLMRWVRDSLTGTYYCSHSTSNSIGSGLSSDKAISITVLGSYVYVAYFGGSAAIKRFDKSDFGNPTAITISGTNFSAASPQTIFNDGTNLYIQTSGSTYNKYSLSGTTATFVSSISYTSANTTAGAFCDGTNVWMLDSTSVYIRKYLIAGGADIATLTNVQGFSGSYPLNGYCALFTPKSGYMCVGNPVQIYSDSAAAGAIMYLYPLTII